MKSPTKLLRRALALLLLSTLNVQLSTCFALGTAFTYQGRLDDSGSPANGIYDLRFALFDAASAGVQQGGLLTNSAVAVTNGQFTVALDFGNQFTGANRWLELGVRTNGAAVAFAALAPRQTLSAVPYALYALTPSGTNGLNGTNGLTGATGATGAQGLQGLAGSNGTNGLNGANGTFDSSALTNYATLNGTNKFSGVVLATNVNNVLVGTFTGGGAGLTGLSAANLTGTIPLAQLPASVVTNGASGVNFSGTFAGNGASLTNILITNVGPPGMFSLLTSNFAPAITVGVGTNPRSVTTADVNNDGWLDLICANYSGISSFGTLSVLTNNHAGGFALYGTNITVGANPASVVVKDVNADGLPDLVCANANGGTLSVLLNNGSGFNAVGNYAVNAGPFSLTTADVNGDGRPDLISASSSFNTVTVLTNNGNGVFGFQTNYPVGTTPNVVVTADVNGDGRPDLITANYGANTLTVLTNNGSGNNGLYYGLYATITPGFDVQSVTVADVNGDGRPDLISPNYHASGVNSSNSLSIFTNNGSGGFGFNAVVPVGSQPNGCVVVDINGDGKMDLVSENSGNDPGGNSLTVLTNTGSGVFVFFTTLAVGSLPISLVTADINNDGRPDLITANYLGNSLSVIPNLNMRSVLVNAYYSGNGGGLTNLNASLLNGQPATNYVSKSGDTMTGPLTVNGKTTTAGGLVIENRTSDPVAPATGQIWLRTDL